MADSSTMNSEDILQQINEQTSELEEGEVQEESLEELEPQREQAEETAEEEVRETSGEIQEETKETSEVASPLEDLRRIKYKGKDIELPEEKLKEYIQKGYKVEETLRELKEKERELAMKAQQFQSVDKTKLNDDFVRQLQESPLETLVQLNKITYEQARQEEIQQRKLDRALEREMRKNLPHWEAISDAYHEYKDEGHDHKTALLLAERDMFANLYIESKQKGVMEGEKKAALKQKAQIPASSKRGETLNERIPSMKDLQNMTSDQLMKALGLKITRHPDW